MHVLGQREHNRAGAAAGGDLERTRNELGHAGGIVDLRHPLGHWPEHAPVVDLLEGFALGEIVAHLADEKHERRGVLVRGMNADRRVRRAGAAGDEGDAGLAGQLGIRICHEGRARFVPVNDQLDHLARVVERVEHADVALSGHAERVVDALDQQLVDEDAGAAARGHAGVGARRRAAG